MPTRIMQVIAVPPSAERAAAFLRMVDDFEAHDAANAAFYASARDGFVAYVQGLSAQEHGRNLPAGWVPCTHRWLIDGDGAIVGATRLRHHIDTPFLASDGGHIGYDVAPSQRGKGYGHAALRVALAEAAARGIDRVLLTASQTNAASRAVIERQGGVLEAIVYSEFWRERLCRYWISLHAR